MDFWQRARSFAEEAAKKSHELTQGIATANFSEVVSEASKRSKELAAEASKRSKELAAEASKKSKELAAEALKRADRITAQIPPPSAVLTNLVDTTTPTPQGGIAVDASDLEKFGVTDDLREFVKGITKNTFQDFPLEDDSEMSDIPTVSNVRQDLNEWQEKHAKFVLLTVKEISKLRYQLCPKVMKERKFWRIYFILVNSHVAPYESRYMEDAKVRTAEKEKESEVKTSKSSGETSSRTADDSSKQKSNNNVKAAAVEQDLDVFLLGDLEDGDDGPDDGDNGDDGFDDDFDKI